MLTRVAGSELPANTLLRPFLDAQLPDGIGMTFDEEMVGWYFPGAGTPAPGRDGDLTIAARIPASGTPAGAVTCQFDAQMTVRGRQRIRRWLRARGAAQAAPSLSASSPGRRPPPSPSTARAAASTICSVNPQTGEAEMRYHLEFATPPGSVTALEGVKYMQKDPDVAAVRDLLNDYTTLYCHHLSARARRNANPDRHRLSEVPYLRRSGRGFESGRISGFVPDHRNQRPGDAVAGAPALYRVHGAIRRSANTTPSVSPPRRPKRPDRPKLIRGLWQKAD